MQASLRSLLLRVAFSWTQLSGAQNCCDRAAFVFPGPHLQERGHVLSVSIQMARRSQGRIDDPSRLRAECRALGSFHFFKEVPSSTEAGPNDSPGKEGRDWWEPSHSRPSGSLALHCTLGQ